MALSATTNTNIPYGIGLATDLFGARGLQVCYHPLPSYTFRLNNYGCTSKGPTDATKNDREELVEIPRGPHQRLFKTAPEKKENETMSLKVYNCCTSVSGTTAIY